MAEYKFQHYVPRTYLEAWENDRQKVHVFMKDPNRDFYKSTDEVLGQNDFYTLTPSNILILTDDDRQEIFGDLRNYNISVEDKKLDNLFDVSMNYYRFDEWDIESKDGSEFSKKDIKAEIERKRILDIEKGWHDIEGEWNRLRDEVIETMNNKSHNLSLDDKCKLVTFITTQKSRNVNKKNEIREDIDSNFGFLKENMTDEEYEEIFGEQASAYFLKLIRTYQKGDEESLVLKEEEQMRNLHMVFYRTIGNKKFLTSDNPAFVIIDKTFYKGRYDGLYFPITPNLLLALHRGETLSYTRRDMPENMIRRVNKRIKENATRFYIKHDV
ncbi:DUF4238 domain-containing protein [Fusibacter sp. JL298sf-3]